MKNQLVFGDFVFSLAKDSPYETLTRTTTGGWVNLDIIGGKPRSFFTGSGLESIQISGKAFGASGVEMLNQLRAIEKTKKPHNLSRSDGVDIGLYKVMSIREQQQKVIADGTPMVINFTLTLEEFYGHAD